MQFSTFAFAPEGVQIMIDKKLTVQLDDISAEVNDFCWQVISFLLRVTFTECLCDRAAAVVGAYR